MQKYLLDTYNQSVAGQSRKQISDLLSRESEQYNYALLMKDRLTLSKHDGISVPDALIDSIAVKSFIYVQQIAPSKYFLMVYTNEAIIWAGRLPETEVVGMLQLHLQTHPKIKLFAYNYQLPCDFSHKKIIVLKKNPLGKVDLKQYRVKQIFEVKHSLNKNVIFASTSVVVLIIVLVVAGLFLSHLEKMRLYLQARTRAANVDVWSSYRQAVGAPQANVTMKNLITQLHKISSVQNFAIKNFKYDGQIFQADLAAFGGSVTGLQQWAVDNQFDMSIVNDTYQLSESIDVVAPSKSFTIMPANKVLAATIDAVNLLGADVAISVGEITQNKNYQTIDLDITLQNQPVSFVQSLFDVLKVYPIKLVSMNGYYTLNSFSGEIKLNIIGE